MEEETMWPAWINKADPAKSHALPGEVGSKSLSDYHHGLPLSGCRHWRQAVQVGRYTVWCSSALAERGDRLDPKPDFGIYLAHGWRDRLGEMWTNGAAVRLVAAARPYPALVVDWPDMSAINVETLTRLVSIAHSKLRQGKQLDIGCGMGHGRTGTLLSALLVRVEHLDEHEAVVQARKRYCRHAVETASQDNLLQEYARGLPWRKDSGRT